MIYLDPFDINNYIQPELKILSLGLCKATNWWWWNLVPLGLKWVTAQLLKWRHSGRPRSPTDSIKTAVEWMTACKDGKTKREGREDTFVHTQLCSLNKSVQRRLRNNLLPILLIKKSYGSVPSPQPTPELKMVQFVYSNSPPGHLSTKQSQQNPMAQPGLLTSVSALIVAAHLISPFFSALTTYPKEFQLIFLFVSFLVFFKWIKKQWLHTWKDEHNFHVKERKPTLASLLCVSLVEMHTLQGQGERSDLVVYSQTC